MVSKRRCHRLAATTIAVAVGLVATGGTASAGLVVISRIMPDGRGAMDLSSTVWSDGWKFTLFQTGRNPRLVAYRPATGEIKVEKINVAGGPNTPMAALPPTPANAGYTHFEVTRLRAGVTAYLYRSRDGAVAIFRILPNQVRLIARGTWTPGWTHMRIFSMPPTGRYVLFYNTNDGRIRTSRLNDDGSGSMVLWNGAWSPGYTHFTPFYLAGVAHMLQYKVGTGLVHIHRINPGAQNATVVWTGTWKPGWTHFWPFRMQGQSYVLEYKALEGTTVIDRMNPDGRGVSERWRTQQWGPGWSVVKAFRLEGGVFALRYRP